jgi:hypothetical protein
MFLQAAPLHDYGPPLLKKRAACREAHVTGPAVARRGRCARGSSSSATRRRRWRLARGESVIQSDNPNPHALNDSCNRMYL